MSREAPQGWLDWKLSQEPCQLFPTGRGSEAISVWPHIRGWKRMLWSLPTALAQPSMEKTSGSCQGDACPLWWERFQQLSVVMLKWLHSGDSQKSHSPLPGVDHKLKDEPNQPQRSRHRPPSRFLLGPNEKKILVIVPFLARQEVQATYKEMPWLCALESPVFELRGFHFKSEELDTQGG